MEEEKSKPSQDRVLTVETLAPSTMLGEQTRPHPWVPVGESLRFQTSLPIHLTQVVFFVPEWMLPAPTARVSPGAGSLLLLCGDIESNPGPATSRKTGKTGSPKKAPTI
jgi:hypothetical protein